MRVSKRTGWVVVGVLALCACKGKTETTGGATPAAASPKAAPSCAEGAIKVADPPFCIKAPPGFKPQAADKSNAVEPRMEFKNEETHDFFAVRWTEDKDQIESTKRRHQPDADPASDLVSQGDLLGGKGHWFYSRSKKEVASQRPSTIAVYVQGPKYLFICESASSNDGPDQQKWLEVCKSIVPL